MGGTRVSTMFGNPNPGNLCGPNPPNIDAFAGPYRPVTGIVQSAFQDCFVDIEFSAYELTPFYQQVSENPCTDDCDSGYHATNPPKYEYQVLGVEYYDGIDEITICNPPGGGWTLGRSCGPGWFTCNHRHAKVFVGIIRDIYNFAPANIRRRDWTETFWRTATHQVAGTVLHELGHQAGGLGKAIDPLIDTDPPNPEWNALVQYYNNQVWAARSVMFYYHDSCYFNPKHVLFVRSGIRCE